MREIRRILKDESGFIPILGALGLNLAGPLVGILTKAASAILTPLALAAMVSLALRAMLGGNDPTRDIFFNLSSPARDAFGVYTQDRWNNLIEPGVAAFWALGGVVAVLGVIWTGYEWYYSSLNPKARASLMETLWGWILGALVLGFYPLWASFFLWGNNAVVQGLGASLPPNMGFDRVLALVEGSDPSFFQKITHPADYLGGWALSIIGRGLLLFYFIFFKIRALVLAVLLWTGPLLGGASLFFRRGASVATRYWLEFLSTVFVQTLLAFAAVFALNFIAIAVNPNNTSMGNVNLPTMVEVVAVLMALLPAANLLRTILGLPVGGMGVVSALGAGMITGTMMLLGQGMRSFMGGGGPVVSMPKPPVAGGGGDEIGGPSVIYGGPPGYPSLPGAPLQLASGQPSAAPAWSGFMAGSEHVRRAHEAGVLAGNGFDAKGYGGVFTGSGRDFEITLTGPPPTIDRPGILSLKENFAAGGELGGAVAAGLMAMGMGNPGFGLFLAPSVGRMAGHRVGSAIGTAPALGKVALPTARAGYPSWKLAGDVYKPGPGASAAAWAAYYPRRYTRHVLGAWRMGQWLVSGVRPDNPKAVNEYLVARNWGVPVAEAFGFRFADGGRSRGSGVRHGGGAGGDYDDPHLAAMFMSHGPSWYSEAGGEVRVIDPTAETGGLRG